MSDKCPHTGEICPVLVNINSMQKSVHTAREQGTLDWLESEAVKLLEEGICKRGSVIEGGHRYCDNHQVVEIQEIRDGIYDFEPPVELGVDVLGMIEIK